MKTLWQPPRLRQDNDHEERRASWLELFFDLVFVATIAELGNTLSDDVSLLGFGHYVALFIPIWWCWVGETFYATRFDQDSLADRLITLVQMSLLVVMAVHVHHGLDTASAGFALAYAAFRVVLMGQYWWAGRCNPPMRAMIRHFCTGFGLSVALWVGSVWVPMPARFSLWALGLGVDLATPLLGGRFVKQFPPSMTHIPERMGLFTIIVLGESLFAAIAGLSKQVDWTWQPTTIAVLGLVTAFSLWWMYFDTLDSSALMDMRAGQMRRSLLWLYLHLPLVIGITAIGVGTKYGIYKTLTAATFPTAGRWLMVGALALCLGTLALFHGLTHIHPSATDGAAAELASRRLDQRTRNGLIACRLVGVGGLLAVAVLGDGLNALAVALVLAGVGGTQVAVGIVLQVRAGVLKVS
jgi:low temperature requirement protein LtrA